VDAFALDILRELKNISTPYVNINNVTSNYDIRSKYFISSYLRLESEDLIASANTPDCGLEVGADGIPSWSVVDVYVTEKGDLLLHPPKTPISKVVLKITEHPVVAALIVAGILGLVASVPTFLGSDQQSGQQQKLSQPKTNVSQP